MYVVSMSLMLPLKETNSSFFHSWDQAYDREIKSFHDVGDVGEIWYLKVQFINDFTISCCSDCQFTLILYFQPFSYSLNCTCCI